MYSKEQAQSGLKAFVITLAVSLLLFGGIYYLLTDFSGEVNIEDATLAQDTGEVKGTQNEGSVFGDISEKPVVGEPAVVLAGADGDTDTTTEESTESVVPDTGSETLLGTTLSVGFFSMAVFVLLSGTRKIALTGFEKDMTKD